MDPKIVHSLFALLDQRIAIDFPGQVFHLAVYFFQRLIDRYGSYGYRTVADDPFTSFMDVFTRRKVHEGIASPFAAPDSLFHFFVDA